ncbi:MAG: HD domain-containing protein [Gemmatimonadota bacterium]
MDIIRDPLWNNIRVDQRSLRLIDTEVFQRLRYVRQLGWAYLVYPGATHARFEHAVGAFHLAGLTLGRMRTEGLLDPLPADEPAIVQAALLLHDIGHYPYSHALEEIGAPDHEDVARSLVCSGEVAHILREISPDAPERVLALIRGRSNSPLQGLVSGSLDLDKIEYLKRDALMCGVPYGEIDVDRLTNALTLVDRPGPEGPAIGVLEKALSALESLLFAKYQMYRNVYWHHAVRSATAMYKRLVEEAITEGAVDVGELAGMTDESLLHTLDQRVPGILLDGLRHRRLFKRAFECPAAELPDDYADWIATDRERVAEAEAAIARRVGLESDEVLLDYPAKTQMLALDLPVVRRDGSVTVLTGEGLQGAIHLPQLSEQLYRSARWLRLFTRTGDPVERRVLFDVLGPLPLGLRLSAGA